MSRKYFRRIFIFQFLIFNLISSILDLNVTTAITALTNRGRSRHSLGDSVGCQEKYMGPASAREVPESPLSYEVAQLKAL